MEQPPYEFDQSPRRRRLHLWAWFGPGQNPALILPRILMHAMPDDWQDRMATLLEEYAREFAIDLDAKNWPEWMLDYEHVDGREIAKVRREAQ